MYSPDHIDTHVNAHLDAYDVDTFEQKNEAEQAETCPYTECRQIVPSSQLTLHLDQHIAEVSWSQQFTE